jgi:predicted alpha/beta hydrolase
MMLARYSMVKGDVLRIGFTDDAFATRAGGDRLITAFPALQAVSVELSPKQAGMREVGHFGFFRRAGAQRLWPFVLGYIRDGVSIFRPAT